jgi:hypothetical protein
MDKALLSGAREWFIVELANALMVKESAILVGADEIDHISSHSHRFRMMHAYPIATY